MDNEYIDTTDNTIDFGLSSESIEGGSDGSEQSDQQRINVIRNKSTKDNDTEDMSIEKIYTDLGKKIFFMIEDQDNSLSAKFAFYSNAYTDNRIKNNEKKKYINVLNKIGLRNINNCINIFSEGYNSRCARMLNNILSVSEPLRQDGSLFFSYDFPPIGFRYKRKYTTNEINFYKKFLKEGEEDRMQVEKMKEKVKNERENNDKIKDYGNIKQKLSTCEGEKVELQQELEKCTENIPVGTPLGEIGEGVVDEDEDQNGGSSSEENTLEDYDKYDLMYNRNKAYYLALKSV